MSKRTWLQDFLVGKELIESRKDYKQALLRGQLGLHAGIICSIYLIVDPLNNIFGFIYLYLIGLAISALAIYLNRLKKGVASSVILLLFGNLIIFLIADVSNPNSGVFFFFMTIAISGLILFYNSNLKIGLIFVFLSLMLGVIAYFNEHPFLELTAHNSSENAEKINFFINFLLGIFSTILVVLFLIKTNKESEWSLQNSKDVLEKLADELTKSNKELKKTNEELDRFVYSASHDMRSPLTTLQGLINVAKIAKNVDEYPMFFDLMTRRIQDMDGFIREVTDYSRNTRLEISNTHVNLIALIKELQEAFSFLANEVGLTFKIDIDPNLTLFIDLRRFKVVLNNLISNAIKYSDQNKEQRFIKLSAKIENKICLISIKDNGVGIDQKYQAKIFNMFYRASEESTGSGLGLYIVKETVNRINGEISFTSVLGQGSTFFVEIPIGK